MGERDDRPSGWEWPAGPPRGESRSRLPTLVWPALFLFYLAQPVTDVFRSPHSALLRAAVVTVTLVYAR